MIEVVLAKRDRFGRKIGGTIRCASTNGQDLAGFLEKQAVKGVKKERRENVVKELYHQEEIDGDTK